MTAARLPVWKTIQRDLTADIAEGRYVQGAKLPTEAALAGRFGVNRHTVRRALSEMAKAGLVHSRRGSGVFVTAQPTDYPIGRRVRFHQNLRAAGRAPKKRVLSIETRSADVKEAEALKLDQPAEVHVYHGISFADGAPIGYFRSVFPAAPFPGLPDRLRASGSVTAALAAEGLDDYIRVSTRITALLADATVARHLQLAEGAPILRTVSINVDPDDRPVEYGRSWFAGDRVTLTLNEI